MVNLVVSNWSCVQICSVHFDSCPILLYISNWYCFECCCDWLVSYPILLCPMLLCPVLLCPIAVVSNIVVSNLSVSNWLVCSWVPSRVIRPACDTANNGSIWLTTIFFRSCSWHSSTRKNKLLKLPFLSDRRKKLSEENQDFFSFYPTRYDRRYNVQTATSRHVWRTCFIGLRLHL